MVALLDDRHLTRQPASAGPSSPRPGARRPRTRSASTSSATAEALIVDDAREHELTKGPRDASSRARRSPTPASRSRSPAASCIGTLCVADYEPRAWKPSEIDVLEDLAASVVTEIEMRADIEARKQAETELQRSNDRLRGLMDNSPAAIYAKDLEGR